MVGSTEVGIEMKFLRRDYRHLIAATHVTELNAIEGTSKGVRVGASVTLSRLIADLKQRVAQAPRERTAVFRAVIAQLRWFAGTQIRNTASLGGNIVTGALASNIARIQAACCQFYSQNCMAQFNNDPISRHPTVPAAWQG